MKNNAGVALHAHVAVVHHVVDELAIDHVFNRAVAVEDDEADAAGGGADGGDAGVVGNDGGDASVVAEAGSPADGGSAVEKINAAA